MAYDVSTESAAGRRRLRRVAHACEAHGQRVQKSVFECTLNAAQVEGFIDRLLTIIALEEDSLRVYRLRDPRDRHVRVFGVRPPHDLHDPLIL